MGYQKRFKQAHIVPQQLLECTANNQYHMCLAHLVLDNPIYSEFFARMSAEGKYVLMDNGAAENSQLSLSELVRAYRIVRPSEVVLPDCLLDGEETVRRSARAIEYFRQNGITCKFMGVPQGKTFLDWVKCAVELLKLNVDSIGVSKFLCMETHDTMIRYNCCQVLGKLFRGIHQRNKEIHLLGCSVGWEEVAEISKLSYVRGCDTALAYLQVQAGEKGLGRPEGEIQFIQGKGDKEALIDRMEYIDTYLQVDSSFYPTDEAWKKVSWDFRKEDVNV